MIFTWWNKTTLATFFKTFFTGKLVGKMNLGTNIIKIKKMKDG